MFESHGVALLEGAHWGGWSEVRPEKVIVLWVPKATIVPVLHLGVK